MNINLCLLDPQRKKQQKKHQQVRVRAPLESSVLSISYEVSFSRQMNDGKICLPCTIASFSEMPGSDDILGFLKAGLDAFTVFAVCLKVHRCFVMWPVRYCSCSHLPVCFHVCFLCLCERKQSNLYLEPILFFSKRQHLCLSYFNMRYVGKM